MAGLELTWMIGGAIGLILLTLVAAVMERLWRNKKKTQVKVGDQSKSLSAITF